MQGSATFAQKKKKKNEAYSSSTVLGTCRNISMLESMSRLTDRYLPSVKDLFYNMRSIYTLCLDLGHQPDGQTGDHN